MIDMDPQNMNKSVTVTMDLLQSLSLSKIPMRLDDIASSIDSPKSTILRYINSLIYGGYIFKDNYTGGYALTWKICGIGEVLKSNMSLRIISSDILMDLSNNIDFAIALVLQHDMECIYLDCIYEPNDLDFTLMHIGKRAPMHTTASGKNFLSQFSEAEMQNYIEEKGLSKLTELTITDEEKLVNELDTIRKNGYAIDNEECESGIRGTSIPIYDYMGNIVAALSSFGSADKFTDEIIQEKILPRLKDAANEISYRLGHSGDNIK